MKNLPDVWCFDLESEEMHSGGLHVEEKPCCVFILTLVSCVFCVAVIYYSIILCNYCHVCCLYRGRTLCRSTLMHFPSCLHDADVSLTVFQRKTDSADLALLLKSPEGLEGLVSFHFGSRVCNDHRPCMQSTSMLKWYNVFVNITNILKENLQNNVELYSPFCSSLTVKN